MSEEKKEIIDDAAEEIEESDRRDFLKMAGKGALALAVVSALGALGGNNAGAQLGEEEEELAKPTPNIMRGVKVHKNMRLNVAKDASRKQFGISGPELGKVLQNEGLIPANIKNLGNAALHVSASW